MFVSISISYTDLTSSFLHPSSLSRYLIELFRQSLSGVHSDATTAHGKQGKTKKAQRKVTRKKKSFPRRAGEEERKTITETERRKKEDLPNDGTGRETEKENLISGAVCFSLNILRCRLGQNLITEVVFILMKTNEEEGLSCAVLKLVSSRNYSGLRFRFRCQTFHVPYEVLTNTFE